MENKKIINFVPTGTQPTRENSLAPLSINEIIEEVHEANELGISMVHIHARTPKTFENTSDINVYSDIINGIRKYAPNLLICTSLTGRFEKNLDARTEVLKLMPDFGSLTMGSIDFPKSTTINRPEEIEEILLRMEKYGVQPEIECFDQGMLNVVNYYIAQGKLKAPFYINIILGNHFNAQSDIYSVASFKSQVPLNSIVCLGGIGKQQLKANLYGLMEFDGVRVGLEDNIYWKYKEKASNMQLLKRTHSLLNELQLELTTSSELRLLGYGNNKNSSR